MVPSEQQVAMSASERRTVRQIGDVLSDYVRSGRDLVKTKYQQVSQWVPLHLREPNRCLAICCSDGVLVRYEPSSDGKDSLTVGVAKESMLEIVTPFSE